MGSLVQSAKHQKTMPTYGRAHFGVGKKDLYTKPAPTPSTPFWRKKSSGNLPPTIWMALNRIGTKFDTLVLDSASQYQPKDPLTFDLTKGSPFQSNCSRSMKWGGFKRRTNRNCQVLGLQSLCDPSSWACHVCHKKLPLEGIGLVSPPLPPAKQKATLRRPSTPIPM